MFFYKKSNKDNKRFEFYDLENMELILSICAVCDVEANEYYVLDCGETSIFSIYKNHYFTSFDIKGIFGDFTLDKIAKHKRKFNLSKNGVVIADIDENNKFNDEHLSVRIDKDEFALVALVVYLLIDINNLFGRHLK